MILWIGGVFVVVFLILIFLVWFFWESPLARIDRILVTGNHTVPTDNIVSLITGSATRHRTFLETFLGTQNMFAWPRALSTSDVELIPQLASVLFAKSYTGHTLTATVVEREPLAIWCLMPATDAAGDPSGDENCFWFDKDGVMFEKAFDTEGSELYAVHDYSQSNLGLGDNILPDLFLGNMLSILQVVKESGLTVKEIALQDVHLEEIDVSTYNGPSLYFSLRFPADEDLGVLANLMAKSNFSSLQYVDLRTENRAYYK